QHRRVQRQLLEAVLAHDGALGISVSFGSSARSPGLTRASLVSELISTTSSQSNFGPMAIRWRSHAISGPDGFLRAPASSCHRGPLGCWSSSLALRGKLPQRGKLKRASMDGSARAFEFTGDLIRWSPSGLDDSRRSHSAPSVVVPSAFRKHQAPVL